MVFSFRANRPSLGGVVEDDVVGVVSLVAVVAEEEASSSVGGE